MDIFLVGPDGTSVELSTDNGESLDNFGTGCSPDASRTTFDDNGGLAISAATTPFAGTFRPEVPLAAFNGKSGAAVNGVWSLRLTDDTAIDTGSLLCWSLFISPYSALDARGAGCTEPLTFLPIIAKRNLSAPDLIVDSLAATSQVVTVVLKNMGNAPVTDAFWVDVYLNPRIAPSHVNQQWDDLGNRGLVWGVTAIPIAANGGTLTLTLNDNYYRPDLSRWGQPLPAGSPVYAQVDSVNLRTTYGGVQESHELLGGAYNNISQTLSTADNSQPLLPAAHPPAAPVANPAMPSRSTP